MQIIDTFQNRLKEAMKIRNLKQVDLVNKTNLDKTLINKYLAGLMKAKQDKLTILANALDVNEVWLMGYDIPMKRDLSISKTDELGNNEKLNYFNKIQEFISKNNITLNDEDIDEINAYIEMKYRLKKDKENKK